MLQRLASDKRMPVDAYDRSDTQRLTSGSLLTADNQIDTTTGTGKLKAVFDNKDSILFPNQFVNVHLMHGKPARRIGCSLGRHSDRVERLPLRLGH